MVDTALQTAARKIDAELIEPLRQALVGRQLVYANPNIKGDGIYNVDINTLSNMGEAYISYALPSESDPRDSIKVTRTNVNIPVVSKGFEIPREDFEAFRRAGIMIDTSAAQSAAFVAGLKEDTLILQGWKPDGTNYTIPGLYQSAGNDYSSATVILTPGSLTTAVAGALGLMDDDNALAPAYNLTMNPAQYAHALAVRSAQGNLELPEVITLLNRGTPGGAGRVLSSKGLPATTALISPVDPARRFIEIYQVKDFTTQLGMDSKMPDTSKIYGSVWALTYPHIKQANALCKLSNIT